MPERDFYPHPPEPLDDFIVPGNLTICKSGIRILRGRKMTVDARQLNMGKPEERCDIRRGGVIGKPEPPHPGVHFHVNGSIPPPQRRDTADGSSPFSGTHGERDPFSHRGVDHGWGRDLEHKEGMSDPAPSDLERFRYAGDCQGVSPLPDRFTGELNHAMPVCVRLDHRHDPGPLPAVRADRSDVAAERVQAYQCARMRGIHRACDVRWLKGQEEISTEGC